jgi:lipocalin-like protein
MKASLVVSWLLLQFGVATAAAQPLVKEALFGTWKIVSVETVRPNGESLIEWMGARPSGWIIYNDSGHMAVQLMRDPRPQFTVPGFRNAPEPEKAAAFDGYYAYFGTYEINIEAGTITHHVLGSLRPNEVGRKLTRQVKLEGGRLTLTTPLFDQEGEKRFNHLVWERVK